MGWPNTLLPLKWRERKSKSEKSLNFSAFFFASLPNGRIELNELEVPLGLNEAAFVGSGFLYHLEGRAGMSPEEFMLTVVSVYVGECGSVCVCVCVCV